MTVITKAITEKKASDKMEQPLFAKENATVSMDVILHSVTLLDWKGSLF